MLKDLVYNCRSYRRFYENVKISDAELKDLADLARMTASTANSQALKFRLVNTEEENALVYPHLSWAGALPDWDGPEEGERPAAYIIIVEDGSLGNNKLIDTGITAQMAEPFHGSTQRKGACFPSGVQKATVSNPG